MGTSETAFNALLGQALGKRNRPGRWEVISETTGLLADHPGQHPDILIRFADGPGLPVVIENEYDPARSVEREALDRLGKALIGGGSVTRSVCLITPKRFRNLPMAQIEPELNGASDFRWALLSGRPPPPLAASPPSPPAASPPAPPPGLSLTRFPSDGWLSGSLSDLAGFVEMVMVDEDRQEKAASLLQHAVDSVAQTLHRMLPKKVLKRVAHYLMQQDNINTTRMAATLMGNAFVFERAIDGTVNPQTGEPLPVSRASDSRQTILSNWYTILDYNYWPIFYVSAQVLEVIPDRSTREVVDPLIAMADELVRVGVTRAGDLAGQMFGKLITDRKFLAAFYTLPASAFLLAETCITRMEYTTQPDWSDVERLTKLKVADFACGTGALLTSAYQIIAARMRRAGADDRQLHRPFMEQVITGADIVPSAVHLTATLLASVLPAETFGGTNIALMPYGDGDWVGVRVGSLELLDSEFSQDFGWLGDNRRRVVGGKGEQEAEEWFPHASADLILMNPPFTRPTSYENFDKTGFDSGPAPIPSFAGLATDPATQQQMSDHLKMLIRQKRGKKGSELFAGDGYAGLASHFTDLADVKIKTGGTVGLIVPFTSLAGASWKKWRKMLSARYHNLVVFTIVSTGSEKTSNAFSADTGMAEAMIVATRRGETGVWRKSPPGVLYVNLHRRPASPAEAVEIARSVTGIPSGRKMGEVWLGNEKVGDWARRDHLDGGWGGVRKLGVAATAEWINSGVLALPAHKPIKGLPLIPLTEVSMVGPVHRNVGNQVGKQVANGPFEVRIETPKGRESWAVFEYPILWSHDNDLETHLEVLPDCDGAVKLGMEKEALRLFNDWKTRFHPNLDFRLTSQPLAACLTPEPSLGGRAWPSVVFGTPKLPTNADVNMVNPGENRGQQKMINPGPDLWDPEPVWEYPAVLWANTTLGLMDFWFKGSRQQQGRASTTVTRLGKLLTIDPRELSDQRLNRAKEIYYQFKSREFLPANEAYRDRTRQALDEAVLGDLLGLDWEAIKGPLAKLRLQWCCEPSVHGGKSTKPPEA